MSGEPRRKLAPHEAWDALEKMAREQEQEDKLKQEADRILALSDEELDKELKESGLDPQAVREKGRQLGLRLERERAPQGGDRVDSDRGDADAWVSEAPPPSHSGGRTRKLTRRSIWLIAAALALLLGVGVPLAAGLLSKREPEPPVSHRMPRLSPRQLFPRHRRALSRHPLSQREAARSRGARDPKRRRALAPSLQHR